MCNGGIRHGRASAGRASAWLARRGLFRVRLVVVAVCLVAAGAAAIGLVSVLAARGRLMAQADAQLRAYAAVLVSGRSTAAPAAELAASPGDGGAGGSGFELLSASGQLVARAGRIPAVTGAVVAGAGRPAAVSAGRGRGSWLVVAEPVRYRARRILFVYGANDLSLMIADPGRPGLPGKLIAGVDLSGVDRALTRFALACLAVSAAAVVAVALLGAAAVGALWRPLAAMEQAIGAVRAGALSGRAPDRGARGEVGRLTTSLNAMLGQIEARFRASAESEAAARTAAQRLRRHILDTGRQLRGPLSVIRGGAGHYRQRGPLSTGEVDRMMRRVAAEAARLDALLNDLPAGDRGPGCGPIDDRGPGGEPTGDRGPGGEPTGDRGPGCGPIDDRSRGAGPTGGSGAART